MNYARRSFSLREFSEPEDLRLLRRQAERIKADKALAARRMVNDFERDNLRREIIAAGEQPCR
jgi:hypothetical protein